MTLGVAVPIPTHLEWATRLTGIAEGELREARAAMCAFRLVHVNRELASDWSLDSLLGAWMLGRSLDALCDLGVAKQSLARKLRADPDVWPTWAELVAAAQIAKALGATAVTLEPERGRGTHPDFAFETANDRIHVEFKALGLSDAEVQFCTRMAPGLRSVCPPEGIATFTVHQEAPGISLSQSVLGPLRAECRSRLRKALPPRLWGLAAAVATMQETEAMHAARIREAIEGALRQIEGRERSWIVLHWSGGGSLTATSIALSEMSLPSNLEGVILVGAGVLLGDPRLHWFLTMVPRGGDPSGAFLDRVEMRSAKPTESRRVLAAFEESRRVRACVLRAPSANSTSSETLLERVGKRILPFNLLLSTDPDTGFS